MSHMNALVLVVAQAGPTELFLPRQDAVEGGGVFGGLFMWAVAIVLLVFIAVWMRAIGQRRIDPKELAFRALARKLKLSGSQTAAIRALSQSAGVSPVGLLMSPSAVRSAAEK